MGVDSAVELPRPTYPHNHPQDDDDAFSFSHHRLARKIRLIAFVMIVEAASLAVASILHLTGHSLADGR